MKMDEFEKRELTIRQLLIGKGYFNALVAMEFAKGYHVGYRKDGVTPEFDHQISIALFALTLPAVMYPEELIAVIFLHDVQEDYDIASDEIRNLFRDSDFADRVVSANWKMTKTWRGQKKEPVALFEEMGEDAIASLAKLCDRMHNLQTMVWVFSPEKQREYIEEARTYFLPMAKKARRLYPHQVMAYENLKWMLKNQIFLIESGLGKTLN